MKKIYLSLLLLLAYGSLQAQGVVSGSVYNDINAGITIDNSASPFSLPKEGLVAVLINSTTNNIVATNTVNAFGAFTFGTRPAGSYYAMIITPNESLLFGDPAPSVVLETGWVRTGESSTGVISETLIDGKTNVFTVTTLPVNILFGVQQRPFSDRKMNTLIDKAAVTPIALSVNTGSMFTKGGAAVFSAVDSNGGNIIHYTINVLPRFGTLYLGATPVTSLAQVDTLSIAEVTTLAYLPNSLALSEEQDYFTYYATDNGHSKSNNAVYSIPFALLESDMDLIANRDDHDDDNDGILDVNECNLMDFPTVMSTYPGAFTFLTPSDFGLSIMHRVGATISQDISGNFGKPAGSVIVNITNANTHPTADAFYVNDSTGATQWSISGTLGNFLVLTQGMEYYSYDTRTITTLNGTPKYYVAGQTQLNPSELNWSSGDDGFSWWLFNDNPLNTPASQGALVLALTDPEPKYFEMASTANNRNEWATYFVEIQLECDDDNDGIPNRLDLDSDNDGCADALEGDGNVVIEDLTLGSGTTTVGFGSSSNPYTICASPSCVDANGVPIFVGATGQTVGTALNEEAQSIICTASIDAVDDDYTATPVMGITGNPNLGNILTNDTLNTVGNIDIDSVTISILTPATPNTTGAPVPAVDPATGTVSIPAGTPSGPYEITYEICYTEVANVCDTAVVTVLVDNPIVAIDNDYGVVDPGTTGITTASILADDSLGGVVVDPADITVTPVTPIPSGLTLNPDGTITVASGTPAGTYTFDYEICEIGASPANCDTATVTLTIPVPPSIEAIDDDYTTTPVMGTTGNPNLGNILTNDTLNTVGNIDIDSVTISILTPATPNTTGAPVPAVDPTTGIVSVPAGTPSGPYDITYEICYTEVADVCDTAVVTVLVDNPIIAIDNDYGVVDPGTTGITTTSILADDSLGGVVVDPADINFTPVTTVPTGLTLNPDGTVTVAAGTPAGTYTFDYEICEIGASPANCDTATVTLTIDDPMSVSLLYFQGMKIDNQALLEWATGSEQNNKGFDIERSKDGIIWNKIGFINTKAENGNSNITIAYNFSDKYPEIGQNFYRLKQTDFDGKFELSKTIIVNFNGSNSISIYPNPATESVSVIGLQVGESINIIDNLGKIMYQSKAENTSLNIDLRNYTPGTYHISIINKNGTINSYKLTKTN